MIQGRNFQYKKLQTLNALLLKNDEMKCVFLILARLQPPPNSFQEGLPAFVLSQLSPFLTEVSLVTPQFYELAAAQQIILTFCRQHCNVARSPRPPG